LMEQFQYYDTAAHQASHRDIKQQADRLADAIEADIPTAISECVSAMQGWINEHMCGVDRKLADFLSERNHLVHAEPETGAFE
jgi:hemerythrin